MQYKKIGDLTNIEKGRKNEIVFNNKESVRYIQIEDLRNNTNLKYVSYSDNIVKCSPFDILIAWDGANAGTIGFGLSGAIGSTIAKLSPKEEYESSYLGRFLQFKSNYLRSTCTGATIPHISKSILKNLEIPLPPLPEQKRIADILDKADRLRRTNQELLDAYNELQKSVFLDMFGDPVTNPKRWELTKFNEIIENLLGGISIGGEQRKIKKDEYGVLKVSAVSSGQFRNKEYKAVNSNEVPEKITTLKRGDLLFSRANTRELVGAVAIVDRDYRNLFLPDKIWRIDVKNSYVSQYYLYNLFTNKRFRPEITKIATGTSGSMLNISKEKLRNLILPLPPLPLQNQFAQIIENIEFQKALVKKSRKESEDLFHALEQKAFSGQL